MTTRRRDSKGRFLPGKSSKKRRTPNPKIADVPVSTGVKSGASFGGGLVLSSWFSDAVDRYVLSKVPAGLQIVSLFAVAVLTGMVGISMGRKYRRLPVPLFFWGLSAPFFVRGYNAARDRLTPAVSPAPAPAPTNGEGTTAGVMVKGDTMLGNFVPGDTMSGRYTTRGRGSFGNPMYGMRATS